MRAPSRTSARKGFYAGLLAILLLSSLGLGSRPVSASSSQAVLSPECQAFLEKTKAHPEDSGQLLPPPGCPAERPAHPGLPIERSAQNSSLQPVSAAAAGGPDDFGYTWNDSVAYNWINATTDSGLHGDDEESSTVNIGFPFTFYGMSYTQLYFNTNGLVTFGNPYTDYYNTQLPFPPVPNNLIAVFWDDLAVGQSMYSSSYYNDGKIYTLTGGTAPNRYFVIEWYHATSCCTINSTEYKTFEVVLWENGNITAQYQSLAGFLGSATVGIEDIPGTSGLQYVYNSPGLGNNKAVQFVRPAPSARVSASPLNPGEFTHPGGTVPFEISIRNSGELGTDTYDLSASSTWGLSFFAEDGVTPLINTDGGPEVDTGPVQQGYSVTIVAKITTPGGAVVGNSNTAAVTIKSSLNPAKSKTVNLRSAIPASFAQIYMDSDDAAMDLYLVDPAGQKLKKSDNVIYGGNEPAIAPASNGNFVYAWDEGNCAGTSCQNYVYNLRYSIVDKYGETVRALTYLTDNSNATMDVYDESPAVSVTPDGRIGILWLRYLRDWNISRYNFNIYFAILDPTGALILPPTNLTNNSIWGNGGLNQPQYSNPRIAVTGDNRFVLAWSKFYYGAPGVTCSDYCSVNDVYYAIRTSGGSQVLGPTQFTADTAGPEQGYYNPGLASLSGNKVLLTWNQGDNYDINYAVLNSNGGVTKNMTQLGSDGLTNDDWMADAVQLPTGNIVVGWTGGWWPNYQIRFAVLDSSYNLISGPTTLSNPEAITGNGGVSVASDSAGHAILTWMDYDVLYRYHLYYALVTGSGTVLTSPMAFQTSQAFYPNMNTSFFGYGNAYYAPAFANIDLSVDSSALVLSTAESAMIPIRYGNSGATTAEFVELSATLGTGLTYSGDTSGYTPTVVGSTVTWDLPDLALLDSGSFDLYVTIGGVPVGSAIPVHLGIASAGTEANPADNSFDVQVVYSWMVYLPLVIR